MTVAALHKRVHTRFRRLERRIDARFKSFETRVDVGFKAVDARFTAIDARLDAMDGRMRAGFESIHDQLNSLGGVIKAQSDQFDKVTGLFEQRLRDLEPPPRT